LRFEVGVRCLQAGILLLCLAARRMYGVLWHYDFSIVGGLGLCRIHYPGGRCYSPEVRNRAGDVFQYGPARSLFWAASYWIFVFGPPGAAPAHAEDFAQGACFFAGVVDQSHEGGAQAPGYALCGTASCAGKKNQAIVSKTKKADPDHCHGQPVR